MALRQPVQRAALLLGLSLAALASAQAQAQVTTTITPDAAPGFETGTTVATNGTVTQISGGEVAGTNLFHSFAQFDLGNGDTATWVRGAADANAITNVVNRVRSGTASHIYGTIRLADMPNADFWFINPAGVVFGDGASVQVPNAAHFATAQELRFGGGQAFSTVTPDGSTFSSAPPQAFGFLGGQGNIRISGTQPSVGSALAPAEINLTGANVLVDGQVLTGPTRINLTAVGSDPLGSMPVDGSAAPVPGGAIVLTGNADMRVAGSRLTAADVVVQGGALRAFADSASTLPGNGDIVIRADRMHMDGGEVITTARAGGNAGNVRVTVTDSLTIAGDARISASTIAAGDAGTVSISAATLTMTGGSIQSSTTSTGNAGSVSVSVGNAVLSGDARVASNALAGSTGAAGNVIFDASEALEIHDLAGIIAGTRGTGMAGLVEVSTPLLLMDGGAIASSTEDAGDAGDVLISAGTAMITGTAKINSGALPGSTGQAGLVAIVTDDLLLVADEAVISASTAGPGDAGAVLIETNELVMEGGEIASFTRGAGDAGLVLIEAQEAMLVDNASINSLADGVNTGDAGGVGITVGGQLVVASGSTAAASTLGAGNAGQVGVWAGSLIVDGGLITSATSGSGHAGDVVIEADDLQVINGGAIGSQSLFGASGDAGDVTVTARDTLLLDFGDISAASQGMGFAGIVEVNANVLDMRSGAINSFTGGPGDAGLVGVFVNTLNMTGGRIDSASDSDMADAGNAGAVLIEAGTAHLSGEAQIDSRGVTGNAGDVTLVVDGLLTVSDFATISAATEGAGQAGLVQVMADELVMDGGAINSFTRGSGHAGLVEVIARQLTMSGGRIDSSSDGDLADAGDAGGVIVQADNVALSGFAVIESLGVVGDAGDVRLEVLDTLSLADQAQISAAGEISADAGSVFVIARLLDMSGGEINSLTRGSGTAGIVLLDLGELLMTGGRITSASQGPQPGAGTTAGDAGDVFLRADSALLAGPVSIDSASLDSNAGGVTLEIAGDLHLRDGAQVSTSALGGGDAGDVEIVAGTLRLENFAGITSTAEGAFSAGTITVAAQDIDLLEGSEISTDSTGGPAGNIALLLPTDGTLRLAGEFSPAVITTSSGANTGGQIIISDPFLILSEGGSILALGQQGGANVQIQSAFFIRSSDRVNLVSVDGSLLIESNVGEQITGTEVADVPFLDASGILSGQCSGVRQGGEVSQFSSRVTGPYALPLESEEPDEGDDEDGEEDDDPDRIAAMPQGMLAACG